MSYRIAGLFFIFICFQAISPRNRSDYEGVPLFRMGSCQAEAYMTKQELYEHQYAGTCYILQT